MKRLLEEYCRAMFPDDYDAQDDLFDRICAGEPHPTPGEMQKIILDQQNANHDPV